MAVGKRPGGETFTMSMFLPEEPGRYRLEARLSTDAWAVDGARTVMRLPDRAAATGAGLVLLGNGLRRDLPQALNDLPRDWSGPIVAYLRRRASRRRA